MENKKVTSEGVVVFQKSEDSSCICCEGAHVFSKRVDFEDHTNFYGEPTSSSDELLQKFISYKNLEGKRIRVTIEVL